MLSSGQKEMYEPIQIFKIHHNYFECYKLNINVTHKSFLISTKIPDNVVSTGNHQICTVTNIICIEGTYKCIGNAFKYLRDFYNKPMKSSKLGIYFAEGIGKQLTFHPATIKCKYLAFPYKNGFYLTPMLHQKLG